MNGSPERQEQGSLAALNTTRGRRDLYGIVDYIEPIEACYRVGAGGERRTKMSTSKNNIVVYSLAHSKDV